LTKFRLPPASSAARSATRSGISAVNASERLSLRNPRVSEVPAQGRAMPGAQNRRHICLGEA
ncbi:MAG: hypothetical protein K2F88_02360, partial [Duncaniella sp.]|nr:hypothetical protein [Duncaniella sp.]